MRYRMILALFYLASLIVVLPTLASAQQNEARTGYWERRIWVNGLRIHKSPISASGLVEGVVFNKGDVVPYDTLKRSLVKPGVVEVLERIEVKPGEDRPGALHFTNSTEKSFYLEKGQRFEVIDYLGEGSCTIKANAKRYDILSCVWMDGFNPWTVKERANFKTISELQLEDWARVLDKDKKVLGWLLLKPNEGGGG